MESRVLPDKEISAILAENFVCVKISIDKPPAEAEKLLSQVGGGALPFFVYATPEGALVWNSKGYRNEVQFKADLESVLRHDLLKASAAADKRLSAAAEQAAKDIEAKKYAAVVKAAKDAEGVKGYSASRKKLQELLSRALAAGRRLLEEADGLVKEGKQAEALPVYRQVQADFRGTELETTAKAGGDAIDRAKSPSAPPPSAPPPPAPDTVVLKDGTTVSGRIFARAEEMIMLKTADGKIVKIETDKIAEIKSAPKK
jgi:hypothetical protein